MAKVHKMAENESIENLPLRPIISNIGTAFYYLVKHLAKLLSPLTHSEFTLKNTKVFIREFKNMLPPDDYKLILFDVISLFTNVPSDYTINIILKRVYYQRELETKLSRKEMNDPLLLCTKNVHFSYDNKLYSQKNGVAMGSPLGPVIAGIFMVDLERNVIPKLSTHMTKWKRYVDDTITYINPSSINYVLSVLNSFHKNIKFTFEEEKDHKISFLDVLILRNGNSIETTVYRKLTHNDVYSHWNSFSPNGWKVGTLKTLLLRAFVVCSNKQLLNKEIEHLRNVFHHTNGYPKALIQNVISKVKEEQSVQSVKITQSHQDDISKSYF